MASSPRGNDSRFIEGIQTFNEGRHWHAHEAWEGLWKEAKGADRKFVQALIFVAALLVHYGRKNSAGVLKHWKKVEDALPPFFPTHWGVDVEGLFRQVRAYMESAHEPATTFELDPAKVQIRMVAGGD